MLAFGALLGITEKLVAFAEEILNAREPPKNDVACALESLRRASAAGFIAACVYRAKVSFAERLGDQINKDSVVVDLFAVVDRALELGVASPGPLLQNLALAEEAVFYSYYVFKETPIGEAIGRPFIPQRLDALERIISVAMKYAQVPEPRSARVAKEARITKEARIIISRAVSTVYEITRFIVSNPGSPLETKYTAQWIFDVLQSAIDAGCNDESIKGGMTTADAMLHQGEMLLE
ncbi:hypothetical protein DFJ74DRAFT_716905 [Hyaloraphidium curvatum]|nr:hypothetical protein DFJ74DRAFT_716905 [Hyaloraphidium curvatum]